MKTEDSKFTMSGRQFRRFTSNIVYIWKRAEHILYVGSSQNGLHRVLNGKHHVIGIKHIQDDDVFEIRYCSSIENARELEQKLIDEYRPLYNHNKMTAFDRHLNTLRVPIMRKVITREKTIDTQVDKSALDNLIAETFNRK
jgi:Nuclease subunit of the excinuclease complex